MARLTPIISISVNGGNPNVSNDDVPLNSTVILENTDINNVDAYSWKIVSKPPESNASLSIESWRREQDGPLNEIKTSFIADAYGSYIIELTLNRRLKGTVGVSVRSPYLNMRLPCGGERNEFNGWSTAIYNGLLSLEEAVSIAGGEGNVGGDLDGNLPNPTVVGLQGRNVSSFLPSVGETLIWNGSYWYPNAINDTNAIHDDISGEINSITEKSNPTDTDLILIEDSDDGYSKKKVSINNLPSSGGGGGMQFDVSSLQTTNYTASFNEHVRCDANSGSFDVELPSISSGDIGKIISIKNEGGSDVTISPPGGVSIIETYGGSFNLYASSGNPSQAVILMAASTSEYLILNGGDLGS